MTKPGPDCEKSTSHPCDTATFATKSTQEAPQGAVGRSFEVAAPPFVANVANVARGTPENRGPGGADRRRLANRREHELITFEHAGIVYTAGVGRFDNGNLAEVFLSTAKHGTGLDTNARDAAISASLLLQHGCPSETLRRALTRNADGSPGGALAQALDIFEARDE
jgi:hypothetical protein